MKGHGIVILLLVFLVALTSCSVQEQDMKTLSTDQLRDKIAGGWAGKMIGVSYGAPTEFNALGEIYEKELAWKPSFITGSLDQDNEYVFAHSNNGMASTHLQKNLLNRLRLRVIACGMPMCRPERTFLTV